MSSGKKSTAGRVTPLFLKSGFVLVVPDDPADEARTEAEDRSSEEPAAAAPTGGNDSP